MVIPLAIAALAVILCVWTFHVAQLALILREIEHLTVSNNQYLIQHLARPNIIDTEELAGAYEQLRRIQRLDAQRHQPTTTTA